MNVIHLHVIYLRYAVSQAKSKEKRLAYRPTEPTNSDQPLNAYDVAAKSCIKSWVWSTLCTKPPSAESEVFSELSSLQYFATTLPVLWHNAQDNHCQRGSWHNPYQSCSLRVSRAI